MIEDGGDLKVKCHSLIAPCSNIIGKKRGKKGGKHVHIQNHVQPEGIKKRSKRKRSKRKKK